MLLDKWSILMKIIGGIEIGSVHRPLTWSKVLAAAVLLSAAAPGSASGAELADPPGTTTWGSTLAAALSSPPLTTKGAVVVGCEGIIVTGSGKIDAWDSRYGLYNQALATDNTIVATLSPTADISVSGWATVWGDVVAARDVLISNGQMFTGDLIAGRNIVLSSNPPCPAKEVYASGSITTPGTWWDDQCGGTSGWVQGTGYELPPMVCDPLNVTSLVGGMVTQYGSLGSAIPWPHTNWRNYPVNIDSNSHYSGFTIKSGTLPVTLDATKVDYLYIDGDFRLEEDARLHILNPHGLSDIQQVRIVVNGNVYTGGSTHLNIDPGVSVRLYATGTVQISGGAGQDIPPSIEIDGVIHPTFGIYTSWVGGEGAIIDGNAPLTSVLYAPLTDVKVDGSGEVFGAVRGRIVRLMGSGAIHYDEGLDINNNWDGGPIFVVSADLAVDLAADSDEVGYNADVTLSIGVNSSGAGEFDNVSLDVVLPADLTYVSHLAPPGTSFIDTDSDGIPDTWLVGQVAPGTPKVLEVLMRGVNRPDSSVVPVEVALAGWSGNTDSDPGNNSRSIGIQILPSPLLTITKSASVANLGPGEVIAYTTTLVNIAEAPAHEVWVSSKIDDPLAFSLDAFGAGAAFEFVEIDGPTGLTPGSFEYSNDGGATWGYVPASGAGGAPPGYDATVTHWRVPMTGVMNPHSSFRIEYRTLLPNP